MKPLYKVRNKLTGKYMELGSTHNKKTSWRIYPKTAISHSTDILNNPDDYEVEVYELVLTDRLNIKI